MSLSKKTQKNVTGKPMKLILSSFFQEKGFIRIIQPPIIHPQTSLSNNNLSTAGTTLTVSVLDKIDLILQYKN